MDHGIDRLHFFVIFLFFLQTAFATSFGPIQVTEQIRNAQYFVHGKISSDPTVRLEPTLNRPYTYWDLQIIEQFRGSLPSTIAIRQPGGEINDIGYHVAGAAQFSLGEEVYVALNDTKESAKEVVAFASGKYQVGRDENGRSIVRSGLGLPLLGADGKPMTPTDFSALIRRVTNNAETDSDKKIFLNKDMAHDTDPVLESQIHEALALQGKNPPKKDQSRAPIPVQESPVPTDEIDKGTGNWQIPVGIALLAFAVGLVFILRK